VAHHFLSSHRFRALPQQRASNFMPAVHNPANTKAT